MINYIKQVKIISKKVKLYMGLTTLIYDYILFNEYTDSHLVKYEIC